MPSTSVELYTRLRLKIEAEYAKLAELADLSEDSPWRNVLVDHGEVQSYCEDELKKDGFTFLDVPHRGWMVEPEKYNHTSLSDQDDICDYLQYLIEEWDYALTVPSPTRVSKSKSPAI